MANLGKAEIDGQHGLREAIVKLAADAAALFVLKFDELGGELVDGTFGVFELGHIGEGGNEAGDVAVGVELRNYITESPEDVFRPRMAKADEGIVNGGAGAESAESGAIGLRDVVAVLVDDRDAKFRGQFSDASAFGRMEHAVSGAIGEFNAGIRGEEDDGVVEVADQRAEAFLARAKDVFGLFALGNVANDDKRIALAFEGDEGGVHLADAELAGLLAELELHVADVAGFDKSCENGVAVRRVDPKIHLAGSFVDSFLASVTGKASEAIVNFEVGAVGEGVDAEGIGAAAEGGGKHLLGEAEGLFRGEQVLGGDTLAAVREDKTNGRTGDGSGDGEPGKE